MANYIMKQTSQSTWSIMLRRKKVGFVRHTSDGYVAKIGDVRQEAASASEAFSMAVKSCNRIALCGEDDIDKARDVIAEQNERVTQEAREFNEKMKGTGIRLRTRSRRVNI